MPVTVLYLGGLGRSGSTLLERCVGQLSDAYGIGELVHVWERGLLRDELCGCGERFRACPFWSAIGQRAFGGWEGFDLDEALRLKHAVDRNRFLPRLLFAWYLGTFRRDLRAYVALYDAIYQAVAEETGARVIVDSSKHASLACCLLRASRHCLRAVHVVRDSPAVVHSWTKVVARPEALETTGEGAAVAATMARYTPLRAAWWWDGYNVMFGLLSVAGLALRRVRYEDFVAAPLPVVRSIAEWAGSRADPADFLEGERLQLQPSHTVAGNPMRFRVGEIAIRRDDAWRSAMPAAQQRLVRRWTWPFRLRYGYTRVWPVARAASRSADST